MIFPAGKGGSQGSLTISFCIYARGKRSGYLWDCRPLTFVSCLQSSYIKLLFQKQNRPRHNLQVKIIALTGNVMGQGIACHREGEMHFGLWLFWRAMIWQCVPGSWKRDILRPTCLSLGLTRNLRTTDSKYLLSPWWSGLGTSWSLPSPRTSNQASPDL